jgi:4-amino-4-deoxy-L-arabinose transferase-like glycosyltransferase
VEYTALGAGLIVGMGTLFRPETPMLLVVAAIVFGVLLFSLRAIARWFWVTLAMSMGCLVVLSPWALRNMVTLGKLQFLTPTYSTLPGELVPYGFMAWEKTWLYRVRDCYLVPWKLNEEAIEVDEIPARAFDSPEDKQRVAAILEQYNQDLTLTKEEDDAFGQIARERTSHHPLRTFLWIPGLRAVVIWFTPRIELLPISGNVFPLAQMHDEDPEDQAFTILLFFLNIVYVGLGAWGALRLWRSSAEVRPVVAFLILFMVLRTAFLTTLETPEPRYVLVCFPALIAIGAQLFVGKSDPSSPSQARRQ